MAQAADAARDMIAVTGASRGIGAAIAVELARHGFPVACLTRQGGVGAGEEAAGPDVAGQLTGVVCDVTDGDSVASAVAALGALPGRLRGLVNCAGISAGGRSSAFSLAEFEDIVRTNLTGTFRLCQAVYPLLVEGGGGLIVNIGSFWDRMGIKRYAAYCASKAGVAALTRCLGVEWAKDGIRVIDVAPGYIETEMTAADLDTEAMQRFLESRLPLGRVGTPDEVARVVAGLFEDDVAYLTATTIYVDGGQGPAM